MLIFAEFSGSSSVFFLSFLFYNININSQNLIKILNAYNLATMSTVGTCDTRLRLQKHLWLARSINEECGQFLQP